ncbi:MULTISPECIES: IclR family transcriptional regulator [Pseudothermotoga]|uniref:Transcriptional regulator IclR n=1 Tax=Pseudothermotoga lettingae (strain ATCC BAA-301 / DSM 14385 / NBRC 107922 / TMO) TaxID=416591 RepID=A8F8F1_PSELT|nr:MULTISPECIES: IclR family transcriptional regulator [Pseudothermotoga]ABV34435.1 Transcriptional regulator IclR [Pseudothermotoga lettingae TMO]KUK21713.1 MAG: Transcriptional regulator IclR [Pseudothermotoga lettingae]MDI3495458.1 hypothetical protein [Pseudothermotoga sp.]GLI48620.1 IclR family transcriptional regulator [Pseudothermotoga lettingae TMO]HBJ80965.1 IclR family transcriptional regulator [Pseudothermotoga sp.]
MRSRSEEKNDKTFLESPRKVLCIIDCIVKSSEGVSVSEVAEKFHMSISNAFKYLKLLEELGFVIKDENKKYLPGFKLVDYGSVILRRINLRDVARPHLFELASITKQTVNLVIKDHDQAVYVEKIESAESMPLMSRVGMSVPLYCTSFGKAILSHLSEKELNQYLSRVTLVKKTSKTITDPQKLISHLKLVKARGYAIDDEENEYGVRCVGSAVLNYEGKPIGAVSIAGSKNKMTSTWIRKYAIHVVNCTREISKKLGYQD